MRARTRTHTHTRTPHARTHARAHTHAHTHTHTHTHARTHTHTYAPPARPPAQVSKEVQAVRDYEAALLRHYQSYLKALLQHGLCVAQGTGPVAHARVAVRCMCQLLTTAPHFNYTCVPLGGVWF